MPQGTSNSQESLACKLEASEAEVNWEINHTFVFWHNYNNHDYNYI